MNGHGLDRHLWQLAGDARPRRSSVGRPPEIVRREAAEHGVRSARVSGADHDSSDETIRQRRRAVIDFGPTGGAGQAVRGYEDVAVVMTSPNHIRIAWRHSDCTDVVYPLVSGCRLDRGPRRSPVIVRLFGVVCDPQRARTGE